PAFCLGLLVAGIGLQVVGIGTLGGFAMGWLEISAILAIVAAVIAAAVTPLERAALRLAAPALALGGGFSLLAWLGLLIPFVLYLQSPAGNRPGGGGPGGGGPGPGGPGGPGGFLIPLPIFSGRGTQPLILNVVLLTVFGLIAWVATGMVLRAMG